MEIGFFSNGQERLATAALQVLDEIPRLDFNTRHAYETAMDLVPAIVQEETPPLPFLQVTDFNVRRAAVRMCSYWKFRQHFFGDRWLLPMNQTGLGALNFDDVQTLRSGYMAYFDQSTTTTTPLLTVDFSIAPRIGNGARILFYYVTTVMRAQVETREEPGLTVVYLVTSAPRPEPNLNKSSCIWAAAKQALPMRIHKVYTLQAYETGKEHLIDSLAFQTTRQIQYKSASNVVTISGNSVMETLRAAKQEGIVPACLPVRMGGLYHVTVAFAEWVRTRLSIEDPLSAATAPTQNALLRLLRTRTRPTNSSTTTGSMVPYQNDHHHPAHLSMTQADVIRQRKAASARRMYNKQKMDTLALQERTKFLKLQNTIARAEQERLQDLLQQAAFLCASLGIHLTLDR